MPLVVDLRPLEKIYIGMSVVINADHRTRLEIDGTGPVLREKDVLREDEANTPCKKAYFLVQSMYLAPDPKPYLDEYFPLIRDIERIAPTTAPMFKNIDEFISTGSYFKAVKEARHLLKHEDVLLQNDEYAEDFEKVLVSGSLTFIGKLNACVLGDPPDR